MEDNEYILYMDDGGKWAEMNWRSFFEDGDVETMKMIETISKIYKHIDEKKLHLDYSGIRSKIKKNGQYYDDFWIKGPKDLGIPGYFELCGIESPGFTASPAISKFLVRKLMNECLSF